MRDKKRKKKAILAILYCYAYINGLFRAKSVFKYASLTNPTVSDRRYCQLRFIEEMRSDNPATVFNLIRMSKKVFMNLCLKLKTRFLQYFDWNIRKEMNHHLLALS